MNRITMMLGIGAFAIAAAACGRQEATGPAPGDTTAPATQTQPYDPAPATQDPWGDPAQDPAMQRDPAMQQDPSMQPGGTVETQPGTIDQQPGQPDDRATTQPGQTGAPGATGTTGDTGGAVGGGRQ
jgi:hypothetical protein